MKIFRLTLSIDLFLISLLMVFSSCKKEKVPQPEFNREIYSPAYSHTFSIFTDNDSINSLINVYNPWQGAENVETSLLVARDGRIPDNFDGIVLKGEAKRIVCMSSSHIGMIDALGETERIVGVSGIEYISNPKIADGSLKVVDVGYEGNINYEALTAIKPDLVLLFSINGESSMEPKLKELGIPFLYIGDYLEESPLGKAEWIIPLGEVMGKGNEAREFFSRIPENYMRIKSLVANDSLQKPKVMVNLPFGDAWFMPSTESFIARLIQDAGADYIYKKNTGSSSLPIDMEEAYQLVSSSDFWINTGNVSSLKELDESYPKFKDTECLKNHKVYNNNLRRSPGGGNDCYESGVVRPDLILRDMIKIFHPGLVEEDFVYYQKLE